MKRNVQFILPLCIVLGNLGLYLYAYFTSHQPLALTYALVDLFDFIFDSTIIFALFLTLNSGKKYSATRLNVILTFAYFIAQWQISSRCFNYVFKGFISLTEQLSVIDIYISPYGWITVVHAIFQLVILISLFLIIRFWLEKQVNENTIEDSASINLSAPLVYSLLNTSIILQIINPFVYSSDYYTASIIGSILVVVPLNFIFSFRIIRKQQIINGQNIPIKSALIACTIGMLITILSNILLHGLILFLLVAIFSMAGFFVYLGFAIYLSLFVFLYISYKSQQFAIRRFCKMPPQRDHEVAD
ncbi:hypothetical protein [Budvicia aquatica]|uniref:hypothetical protein n=1 Tax=Budvicia aquatica TaxID=82979 RepID=UPI001B54D5CE|nr:hypothetical protein [Budvicia aquatica]MBP9642903.1 hypothetical protein [Budvicia sp.]